MTGWVCSYRKIWKNPLFEGRGDRVAVWHWLLHMAAWQDTTQDFHGKKIPVRRGQLLATYSQIESETGVGRQVTRTLFAHLSGQHGDQPAINIATNTGCMLITICNYDTYQSREGPPNTGAKQQLTSNQHTKEQDKQFNNSPIGENAAAPPLAETIEVSVLSKAVWDAGKPFLASRGVKNPGANIGRWLKTSKPDEVLRAIDAAQKSGTQDPIPYITQILNGGQNEPSRTDPQLDAIARAAAARRSPAANRHRG